MDEAKVLILYDEFVDKFHELFRAIFGVKASPATLLEPGIRQWITQQGCKVCKEIPVVHVFDKDHDILVRVDCHGKTDVVSIPNTLFYDDRYREIKQIALMTLPERL